MKLLRKVSEVAIALGLLLGAATASAAVISFDPTPASGDVSDSIFVDVVFDGTGIPEYLGGYDFDVTFDPTIVSVANVVFDPDFGLDSLGCLVCFDIPGAGSHTLFGLSGDSIADLITNQNALGNTFVLATIEFIGESVGETALGVGGFEIFSDETGFSPLFPEIVDGRICVGPDGCRVAVPEPGTGALLALGLLAFGARRLRRA